MKRLLVTAALAIALAASAEAQMYIGRPADSFVSGQQTSQPRAYVPEPRGNLPPSWLQLKKGTPAYTGGDTTFGDSVSVCGSAREWLQLAAKSVECTEKSRGLPVTIASDEMAKYDWEDGNPDYGVFIRADDGSWSGWITLSELRPRIPARTKLIITPLVCTATFCRTELTSKQFDQMNDKELTDLNDPNNKHFDKGTVVELISQDAKNESQDLYVEVVNNGHKGWLSSMAVSLPDNRAPNFEPPIGYAFKGSNIGSPGHGPPAGYGPPVTSGPAFLKSEGSKLTAAYNEFASSYGFHPTMFLSKTDRDAAGTYFFYANNDCVGALGVAGDGKRLGSLFINATGCQTKEKSDALVHLLMFVANQCSDKPDAERMILAAFSTLTAREASQTIELGTCKISLDRSDVLGFTANVRSIAAN